MSGDYAVVGDGANPADANDFGGAFPSGSFNLDIGQAATILSIDVAGDLEFESDEGFAVVLSNLVNAVVSISSGSTNGLIVNDELDSDFDLVGDLDDN